MKSKIRARVFGIFVGPLIISFVFMVAAFGFLYLILSNDWHLQSDERYICRFLDYIIENYDEINIDDTFRNDADVFLDKIKGQLEIIDTEGGVVFHSNGNADTANIEDDNQVDDLYLVSTYVKRGGSIVAWANISRSKSVIAKVKYQNYFMIFVYFMGIGIMIYLVLVYLKRFTSGYLNTVNELKKAADNIANAHFDFEIKIYNDDELGEFCLYFNQMIDKLNQSIKEKLVLEESRKEMIAAISHDLRTPLTTIKTYVEGLQCHMADDPVKFDQCLEVIQNKIMRLDRLIEDLFQYSQCQINMYEIHREVISLLQFVQVIQSEYEILKEGINIEFLISDELNDVSINIDVDRMMQVIDNLISNAVSHAKNDIKIKISVRQNYPRIIIEVSDNGVGIDEEDLPKIFDRFYRCEKSRLSRTGGMGLGLSICKYIIESHGGEIGVISKLGAGSTFSINLPAELT